MTNLIEKFKVECPVVSKIPLLKEYCFYYFYEGYYEQKRNQSITYNGFSEEISELSPKFSIKHDAINKTDV